MSDSLYCPALDETTVKNLELVRQLAAEHPAYWLEADYPISITKIIQSWFDPKAVKALVTQAKRGEDAANAPITMDQDKWAYLYQESKTLYDNMKGAKYSGDNEEQMSYYKTAASLLEKLISLQERSLGLKQISEHNALVLGIMENILSPTQRNQVMEQLQEALGK